VDEKYRQCSAPPGHAAVVCSDVSAAQSPVPSYALLKKEGPIVQSKARVEKYKNKGSAAVVVFSL